MAIDGEVQHRHGMLLSVVLVSEEERGLIFETGEYEVFVPREEISWIPSRPWPSGLALGSRCNIVICGISHRQRRLIGSIKRTTPQTNPYIELMELPAGVVLCAILKVLEPDVVAILESGASGFLEGPYPDDLRTGDRVRVIIVSVFPPEERLLLQFVGRL